MGGCGTIRFFNANSKVSFTNCSFIQNYALNGAVFHISHLAGELFFENNVFSMNKSPLSAEGEGGVFSFLGLIASKITLKENKYLYNMAYLGFKIFVF